MNALHVIVPVAIAVTGYAVGSLLHLQFDNGVLCGVIGQITAGLCASLLGRGLER